MDPIKLKQIIIDVHATQTRVAVIEESNLTELYIERGAERLVGNIYKGKVANVLPGMQAAFVDIGLDKNAFLYAGDILIDRADLVFEGGKTRIIDGMTPSIKDMVRQGQEIMVQVLKDPGGSKGARVTTNITLPGRSIVLMPTVNYVGVSRKINDEAERERLKALLESIKPEEMGFIVRTTAAGGTAESFTAEIEYLTKTWQEIQSTFKLAGSPSLLHMEDSLLSSVVRDMLSQDINKVVVNDKDSYEMLQMLAILQAPELKERIEYVPDALIFDKYMIEGAIDKLTNPKVNMKNGSYLIFDHTEALTVIDVNTGKYVGSDNFAETVLETNLLAAREIARQLRLRNIGGIIIVDFIDMDSQEHKELVLEELRQGLKKDRVKSSVLGITGLGLVEITRKKMRPQLTGVLMQRCPCCGGSGLVKELHTIALQIRREALRILANTQCNGVLIEAGGEIGDYIMSSSCFDSDYEKNWRQKDLFVRINSSKGLYEYRTEPLLEKAAIPKDSVRLGPQ